VSYPLKRAMQWEKTPGGIVLTCTACSWWAPLLEADISSAIQHFDAHVCVDHPPLKEIEKPSAK